MEGIHLRFSIDRALYTRPRDMQFAWPLPRAKEKGRATLPTESPLGRIRRPVPHELTRIHDDAILRASQPGYVGSTVGTLTHGAVTVRTPETWEGDIKPHTPTET